jgi:pyruvate dehydrogenase E1 component alpha subunit
MNATLTPHEVVSFTVDAITVDDAADAGAENHGWAFDPAELIEMYRAMVLTRTFDAKAVALQRTGRSGTFASSLGQEAVAVGVGAAMADDDLLVPSFREQGAQMLRGVDPSELFLYWGGDERGSDFAAQRGDFPTGIPIGTHVAHATGVALAFQLRGEQRAVVCVFGDGATSRGDVYESMNYAGVRRLPIVYVVNNNQWAISVPRSNQTAAATLAQKAIGCGFTGVQVDGNDVVAVRAVVADAIEQARSGGGPTLVEALTYRLADHTTADDAGRYRSDDEVSGHWKDDPVARLRTRLADAGMWGRDDEERLLAQCSRRIDDAVETYEASPPQGPAAMFDFLHAELPAAYRSQRADAVARGTGSIGDGDG